jgi:hypothetical protein
MNFSQFVGGMLVGVAFGMLIGVAIVQGFNTDVTKFAGVGAILAFLGVVMARRGERPRG